MRVVCISGSREESWAGHEDRVKRIVHAVVIRLEQRWPDVHVIAGEAPSGVDAWAKKACESLEVPYTGYPADWRPGGVFDKLAGFKRNEAMANAATDVVLIWDGVSPGTANMLEHAHNYRLHTEIIYPLTNLVGSEAAPSR